MPTTANFSLAAAGGVPLGLWTHQVFAPHNYQYAVNPNELHEVQLSGTDATGQIFIFSGAVVQRTLDGTARNLVENVDYTPNIWHFPPMFAGLSDAPHTLRLTLISPNGSGQGFAIDEDNAWQVTGAAPAASGSPTLATTARVFDALTYVEEYQSYSDVNIGGYPHARVTHYTDSLDEFPATTDAVSVWCYKSGQTYRLWIDGVLHPKVTTVSDDRLWGLVIIKTGLDFSAEHLYTIQLANLGTFTLDSRVKTSYINDIILGGAGSSFNTTPRTRGKSQVFFGDSITEGDIGISDTTSGFPSRLSWPKSQRPRNLGIASSTVKQFAGGGGTTDAFSGQARVGEVTGTSPEPDYIVLLYGSNDSAGIGGAETTGDFQSAYQSMLSSLVSGTTSAKIVSLGILPRYDVAQAATDAFNVAMQAAITAAGSSRAVYVDTSGWLVRPTVGTDTGDFHDGIHPNQSGEDKLFTRLSDYLGFPFAAICSVQGRLTRSLTVSGSEQGRLTRNVPQLSSVSGRMTRTAPVQRFSLQGQLTRSLVLTASVRGSLTRFVALLGSVSGRLTRAVSARYSLLGVLTRGASTAPQLFSVAGRLTRRAASIYSQQGRLTRTGAASFSVTGRLTRLLAAVAAVSGRLRRSAASAGSVSGRFTRQAASSHSVQGRLTRLLILAGSAQGRLTAARTLLVAAQGRLTRRALNSGSVAGRLTRSGASLHSVQGILTRGAVMVAVLCSVSGRLTRQIALRFCVQGVLTGLGTIANRRRYRRFTGADPGEGQTVFTDHSRDNHRQGT